MSNWLLKTEPSDYSFTDLERDGGTTWDGINNNWALKNLRQLRKGDRALIYHTGNERAVVGEARIDSDPYPDPQTEEARLVVVDVAPVRAWQRRVTLAEIKSDPAFADFDLVRFSRLSVVPVPARLWKRLERMETIDAN